METPYSCASTDLARRCARRCARDHKFCWSTSLCRIPHGVSSYIQISGDLCTHIQAPDRAVSTSPLAARTLGAVSPPLPANTLVSNSPTTTRMVTRHAHTSSPPPHPSPRSSHRWFPVGACSGRNLDVTLSRAAPIDCSSPRMDRMCNVRVSKAKIGRICVSAGLRYSRYSRYGRDVFMPTPRVSFLVAKERERV
jgi:hypothetical protein